MEVGEVGGERAVYNAPDSKPGAEAAIMLVNSADFEGDFREAFDRLLKASTKGHEVLRASDVQTEKTSEGYDVFVQAVVYQTKEGQKIIAQYTAVHVEQRMVLVGFVATTQEMVSKYEPTLAEFLKNLDFPAAQQTPGKKDAPGRQETTGRTEGDPLVSRAARGLTPAQIAKDEAARRKPNTVSGNLYDNRGRPFHFPGVKAWVHIWGFSAEGKRVFFDAQVDANGHYEKIIPHGLYVVNASALFPVGDHPVRVALDALDERPTEETTDSTPGIVTDFGLKLVGPVHGGKPDSFAGYHGGGVYVTDGANWKEAIFGAMERKYPAGAFVEVTLTPRSRLIEGSQGKPLTLKCDLKRMQTGHTHANIPLAVYTVTAVLITPDRVRHPLKVALLPEMAYADSQVIDFVPDPHNMENASSIPNIMVLD